MEGLQWVSWKAQAGIQVPGGLGPQEWGYCTEPLICPAATASGSLVLLDLHPALEPTAALQPEEQTAEVELHTKRASECELQYQEERSGSPCPVQEPSVEPAEAPCSTGQSHQAEQDGPTQPCAVTQSGQVWEHCIDGCWEPRRPQPPNSQRGAGGAAHGTWPVTVLVPLSCLGQILPAPQLTVLPLSPLQFVICVRGQVSGKAAMPQEKPAGKGCPRQQAAGPSATPGHPLRVQGDALPCVGQDGPLGMGMQRLIGLRACSGLGQAVGWQARCLQVPQLPAGLLQGHERESVRAANLGLLHSLSQ